MVLCLLSRGSRKSRRDGPRAGNRHFDFTIYYYERAVRRRLSY